MATAGDDLRTLRIGVLVLVARLLAGCGAEGGRLPAEEATGPVAGGTCVIALFSDFDSLNEFVSTDANATDVMERMLFMPLLRWDENIEIEGRLARSWEFSEDGRGITMELRDDVRWHDGVATTADDVKFTFDTFRKPALG
jgi:peptide/nickel transport system substrate-binding protein